MNGIILARIVKVAFEHGLSDKEIRIKKENCKENLAELECIQILHKINLNEFKFLNDSPIHLLYELFHKNHICINYSWPTIKKMTNGHKYTIKIRARYLPRNSTNKDLQFVQSFKKNIKEELTKKGK